MQLQFEEKTGAALVTPDQLRQTMAVGEFDGSMPASVPLVHYELLDKIISKANTIGLPLDIPPLVIREKYCKKRKDTDNRPENYLVNRMVGKVYVNDWALEGTNDKMRPAIAFSYVYDTALRGIQVSFGQNVDVCDNLTTFGEFTFSTNGNKKMPFDKGMQLLDSWLQNYGDNIRLYNEKIKQLRNVEVTPIVFNTMIGDLFTRAVRANYGDNKIEAPLNQSEVSGLVQQGANTLRNISEKGGVFTGWDVMNWGTAVLKPQTSDMTDLISSTSRFNDYVYEALCVSVDGKLQPTASHAIQLPAAKSAEPELF